MVGKSTTTELCLSLHVTSLEIFKKSRGRGKSVKWGGGKTSELLCNALIAVNEKGCSK